MTDSELATQGGGGQDLEPPLPEANVLTLEEYLDMQAAIGHLTRFRILRTLVHNERLSASELSEALDVRVNKLHYYLDELVDVGLVDHRKRNEPDRDGLYSYYRPTPMDEAILEVGVEELLRREREFLDTYQ